MRFAIDQLKLLVDDSPKNIEANDRASTVDALTTQLEKANSVIKAIDLVLSLK